MGERWVAYGTIARAHGVRGELRVVPFSDDPLPEAVERVRVCHERGEVRVVEVQKVRAIHRALLMTLVGIVDREAAKELAGATIEIEASALPPPQEGEIYLYEIEGARVEDAAGASLGTVTQVIDNGGQQLIVIDSPQGERLLPLVSETLVDFDRAEGRLVVRTIPGLWDE